MCLTVACRWRRRVRRAKLERDAKSQSWNMYEIALGKNAVRQWIVAVCDCEDFQVTRAQSVGLSGGSISHGGVVVSEVRRAEVVRKCAAKWLGVTRTRRRWRGRYGGQDEGRDEKRSQRAPVSGPPVHPARGGDAHIRVTSTGDGGADEAKSAPGSVRQAVVAVPRRGMDGSGGTPLHRLPPRMPPADLFTIAPAVSRRSGESMSKLPQQEHEARVAARTQGLGDAILNSPRVYIKSRDCVPNPSCEEVVLSPPLDSLDQLEAVVADIYHAVSHQCASAAQANPFDMSVNSVSHHFSSTEEKKIYAQALLDYADMLEGLARAHS
jgi:hypothetical protein